MNRAIIRTYVRSTYDIQKLRIATGNRIVSNFRVKLGIAPSKKEDDEKEAKKLLDALREQYKLLASAIMEHPRAKFQARGQITSYAEFALLSHYEELLKQEESQFRALGKVLAEVPIYNSFLSEVRGIGPAMAGVIVSEFDPHAAQYPSSFWKYAGLDVAQDGKGRSRRAEHLVDREYTTKEGKTDTRKSITFNPWLKTKLLGVLGPSFLRANNLKYRKVYDDYRHRLENRPDMAQATPAIVHNRALRYMVKMFLIDLHREWRAIEGLPPTAPYHVAKLGMRDHNDEQKAA
jgi:hypothetical protein